MPSRTHSRTGKALLSAVLTYGQFAAALVGAFVVTPVILKTIGARRYGLWLSTGELVGYCLLLDFGLFAVLPWLIARSDGEGSFSAMKKYVAQGFWVALLLTTIVLVTTYLAWDGISGFLRIPDEEWKLLRGPLLVVVVFLALSFPANLFVSVLLGLQDVAFTGSLNLVKSLLTPVITLVLLQNGYGYYAIAFGATVLVPFAGLASVLRLRHIVPDLLRDWPRPSAHTVGGLFRESIGGWLGSAGIQLIERSSALILAFIAAPSLIPVLICTFRMSQILTQVVWVMPDSGLVGFSQLGGEGSLERQQEVALRIIQLHLVMSGWAACIVLAVNPGFVAVWVGPLFFGGLILNVLLAGKIMLGSIVHGIATIAAVQGRRLLIGGATIAQGVVFVILALALTPRLSLVGIVLADLLSPLLTTVPVSLVALGSMRLLAPRRVCMEVGSLLVWRAGPCLLLASGYGYIRGRQATLVELILTGSLVSFLYLRLMSSKLNEFPLPHLARLWLVRLRFV